MTGNEYLMKNYAPMAVCFEKGDGAVLWDTNGKQYLDALSGIAVTSLGHNHPAVTRAISSQAGQLLHTSNLYSIGRQQQLSELLCKKAAMDKVFFANSGAEANEAAIKLARLYGHNQQIENPQIIVMEQSFHGRTLATLSATGNRKVQAGFEPLVQGFIRAPYNDIEAIRNIAKNNSNVVAILLEPVQGEGGVRIPDSDYLNQIREICDSNGWLMMLDEIQTGIGRTGKWFAYQHSAIKPDVITSAKALGNGVPIGACLARGQAAELFHPGHHGSTFGGNPLACAAAIAVIESIDNEALLARCTALSELLLTQFKAELEMLPGVKDIRAAGLLMGIELSEDCGELVAQALHNGLLINVTAGNVIRLLPPFVMTDEQAMQLVAETSRLIKAFLSQKQTA
ncbi:MAG: aspartate aminotransferase family protein [Gammaproteobacteria bacterium]|nr:aspartate aminotransferase family protein [Gammaproteobacteria bacterium]